MSQVVRVPYNLQQLEQLREITYRVNHYNTYVTDKAQYGVPEYWEAIGANHKGDCEDFALAKMNLLRKFGWPKESLDIGICQTETGEGHAVLVAHMDNGDYVLDNRCDDVKTWDTCGYHWIEVSQGGDFNDWHSIPA